MATGQEQSEPLSTVDLSFVAPLIYRCRGRPLEPSLVQGRIRFKPVPYGLGIRYSTRLKAG